MKIHFIITNAPPLVGGLEKVCLRLAQNLQKQGHKVTIFGRFMRGRHPMPGCFQDSEEAGEFECEEVKVRTITLDAKAKILLKPVFKLIWREWAFPLARLLYNKALGPQLREVCAGCDVVHYFGVGREMLGFAALEAARRVGAAFCVDPAVHPGQWGSFWIDAKLFCEADRMFCYSDVESNALLGMGVPVGNILKVPCGFDYDDSGDGKRFRTKHGITGPMVLFLGRKTKEKGVERLLNAWPMVAEKFPEATLVFAGPKSTLGALEDIRWKIEDRRGEGRMADGRVAPEDRRSETGDRGGGGGAADNGPVEYASHSTGERGVIADVGKSADFEKLKPEKLKSEMVNSESESSKPPRESQGTSLATSYPLPVTAPAALSRILNLDDLTEGEKQDALAACDLLCVPSEGESFGMVYFEAWAYKKPVVGLDLPVLRETIGAANAGILVEKNPQEIAHGISVLLSDSELRGQFGANGHRLALGHKWEEAAKHYLQGYEEAMKTKTL